MSLYNLPQLNTPPPFKKNEIRKHNSFVFVLLIVIVSSIFGFLAGAISNNYFYSTIIEPAINLQIPNQNSQFLPFSELSREEAVIKAVKTASPAVVSIVITKDMPVLEQFYIDPFEGFFGPDAFQFQIPQYRQKGTERKEVGGGTGFIVSEDGMILTNKHVVLDAEANYTVLTNDGGRFTAKVLARDPFQDLAIIKIEKEQTIDPEGAFTLQPFPIVKLGNSDKLKIGQTVIAIGNALGEFRNTVSVGIISGLGRTITASGAGLIETLEDVIQTDAAINQGNSGGPLLNLKGEVIGINVAVAQQAQSIGFAIPANKAKRDIKQVKTLGKIVYPFLGIYYAMITETLKQQHDLAVGYGAWVGRNKYGEETETAIFPESAAEKAGLQKDDIILEFGGEKATDENPLGKIIQKYNPDDEITLKILRGEEEIIMEVILGERSE